MIGCHSPIIPSDSSLQDENTGRLPFPSFIPASSGKVVDLVTLQIWASTLVLTPLVTPVSMEGGQFSAAKKPENVFLTSNQSTSNAAID